jgi:hypothetical protein
MIVKVTKEHIKNGKIGNCRKCPVALAIKEATGCRYVEVDNNSICYSHKKYPWRKEPYKMLHDNWVRCKMTRAVYSFVEKFDEKESVKPFKFRLMKRGW